MTSSPILIPVGDSRDIVLDIKDVNGLRQSLVGYAITLTVYRGKSRPLPVLLTKSIGSGIALDPSNLFAVGTIAAGDLTTAGNFFIIAEFTKVGVKLSAYADLLVE